MRTEAQRLRSPSLHERIGIVQRRGQGVAGGGLADQSERERRHLPDLGVRFRLEQRRKRRDAVRKADASDGQGGAAANARFVVSQ